MGFEDTLKITITKKSRRGNKSTVNVNVDNIVEEKVVSIIKYYIKEQKNSG